MIDGKPLPVGRCSKDPDAHPNQHGRGYKLHMIWGCRCMPEAWEVAAANEYEGAAAERLLESVRGKGVVLGDGSYEANRVYDAAAQSGYLLLAAVGAEDTGGGHGYQSEHRQLALRWMRDGLGLRLLAARPVIERAFGHMGAFGGGLGPVSNWVRRLTRVARWVHCKLLINAACGSERPRWWSRRGVHRLFQAHPEVEHHDLRHAHGVAVEFRAGRHQSALPPSVIAGTKYEWIASPFDVPPPPLPERLLAFYKEKPPTLMPSTPERRPSQEPRKSSWQYRDHYDFLFRHFDLMKEAADAGVEFVCPRPT